MMQEHLTPEQLSAFIDEALDDREQEHARGHIDGCAVCAGRAAQMRSVAASVAALAAVEVDPDTHRAIRQAVLSRTRARPDRRWRLLAASGTALVIIAGGVWLGGSDRQLGVDEMASGPKDEARTLSFDDEAAVRDAVIKDPEVIEGLKSYRVRDVGKTRQALASGTGGAAAPKAATNQDSARAQNSGAAVEQSAAEYLAPAAVSVNECLDRVLDSQPYPMVPLITTDARFKGTPAWLFVFAWTTSTADDARLDRLQIWLVGRDDCATLSFAQLKP